MKLFWRSVLPNHATPTPTSSSDVMQSSKSSTSGTQTSSSPSPARSKGETSHVTIEPSQASFKEHRTSLWTVDALEKHNRNPYLSLLHPPPTLEGEKCPNPVTMTPSSLLSSSTLTSATLPRLLRLEASKTISSLVATKARVDRELQVQVERIERQRIERERMKQEAERRRTEMMRVFGGRRDGNGPPDGDLDIDNFQMFEQFMRDPVLLEMLRQQAEGDFRPEPEEEGQDEWEDDLQEESEGAEEQDEANNPNRMREEPL